MLGTLSPENPSLQSRCVKSLQHNTRIMYIKKRTPGDLHSTWIWGLVWFIPNRINQIWDTALFPRSTCRGMMIKCTDKRTGSISVARKTPKQLLVYFLPFFFSDFGPYGLLTSKISQSLKKITKNKQAAIPKISFMFFKIQCGDFDMMTCSYGFYWYPFLMARFSNDPRR